MLYILAHEPPEENLIWASAFYFDDVYEQSWFTTVEAKEILRGVEHAKYLDNGFFESDYGDVFRPEDLSGGTKALFLLIFHEYSPYVLRLSSLGDNCYPYLKLIPENKRQIMWADCVPRIDDGVAEFHFIEANVTTSSIVEFVRRMEL